MLAQWNLERGLETATLLAERWPEQWRTLAGRLGLEVAELAHWRDVAARLVTGLDPATGRIEQFAGYFDLEDIDLAQYAVGRCPWTWCWGASAPRAPRS